jgi:hypothetical protein
MVTTCSIIDLYHHTTIGVGTLQVHARRGMLFLTRAAGIGNVRTPLLLLPHKVGRRRRQRPPEEQVNGKVFVQRCFQLIVGYVLFREHDDTMQFGRRRHSSSVERRRRRRAVAAPPRSHEGCVEANGEQQATRAALGKVVQFQRDLTVDLLVHLV